MPKNAAVLHAKSFFASPISYAISRWQHAKRLGLYRWSHAESLDDQWDERTTLMAGMITPNSSVLEFGAGKEHLRELLPQGCLYQPSDIVMRSDQTLICDLNIEFPTLQQKVDYIVFSGVLEYVHDVQRVMHLVRANCGACLVSYASTDALECMTTRMRSGWVNHLSRATFETILKNANFTVIEKRVWRGQDIYSLQ